MCMESKLGFYFIFKSTRAWYVWEVENCHFDYNKGKDMVVISNFSPSSTTQIGPDLWGHHCMCECQINVIQARYSIVNWFEKASVITFHCDYWLKPSTESSLSAQLSSRNLFISCWAHHLRITNWLYFLLHPCCAGNCDKHIACILVKTSQRMKVVFFNAV